MRSREVFSLNAGAAGSARYEPLDWLRGMLAAAIMVYHLVSWDVAPLTAGSMLGRLGIYGVSMFFVLSGLSIALAYHRYFSDWGSVARFGVRRIFRIWPLLWLAVISIAMLTVFRGETVSWRQVVLNLTTLFGFIRPSAYMNAGAWSIGNEMVYYACTPVLIALYNRSIRLGNLLMVATIGVGGVFAARWLDPHSTLARQWTTYINPFNNLFLYTAGIALYYNAGDWVLQRWQSVLGMLIALAVFAAYPVAGDQVVIVTGVNRFVFSGASVLLVLAVYRSGFDLPPMLAAPLTQLGLATYGVYLLHPLVHTVCRLVLPDAGASALIPLTIVLTLLVSWVIYHRFELPMMRLGKRLA